MIRSYRVMEHPNPTFFPKMDLALEHCKGRGVELGAASHNPYHLDGAINVAPIGKDPSHPDFRDYELHKYHQVSLCGEYAEIDLAGHACEIPVPDASQDFVLSSHVVEHLPNPIRAFLEWNRVLKPGGTVFMVFPHRDAIEFDRVREITPLREFIDDYTNDVDVDTHPPMPEGFRWRGHYHVFTLASMLELIGWCNENVGLGWEVLATEEVDSKVGNGHTVVTRYTPVEVPSWSLRSESGHAAIAGPWHRLRSRVASLMSR